MFILIKYMLGNVYIISSYCREGFSQQFLYCIQMNPSCLILKQLARKDFAMVQHLINTYILLYKQKNSFQLIKKSLVFNLIAI